MNKVSKALAELHLPHTLFVGAEDQRLLVRLTKEEFLSTMRKALKQ